ncbi:MAG: nucleotide pyrophosphohydrolase [Planctomycetaceae bacterium]|nr:nucleotide pyrophosphohydrolase [Planctomycetaceae bacterium]
MLSMTLTELQTLIREMYSSKDAERGVDGTFMWFMEEVGELAAALRENDRRELGREFADVMAWLVTLANIANIDLTEVMDEKYGSGCPGCGQMVCVCGTSAKP